MFASSSSFLAFSNQLHRNIVRHNILALSILKGDNFPSSKGTVMAKSGVSEVSGSLKRLCVINKTRLVQKEEKAPGVSECMLEIVESFGGVCLIR